MPLVPYGLRAYVQAGWTCLVLGHDGRLHFRVWIVPSVKLRFSPSVLDAHEVEDEALAW